MGIFSIFRKRPDVDLILSKKEKIQESLVTVRNILQENNHPAQAEVVQELIDALPANDVKKFLGKFHTVDMWGGSGAVWEVAFGDNATDISYMKAMIRLIFTLEGVNITNGKIRSVKKYFLKQIPFE